MGIMQDPYAVGIKSFQMYGLLRELGGFDTERVLAQHLSDAPEYLVSLGQESVLKSVRGRRADLGDVQVYFIEPSQLMTDSPMVVGMVDFEQGQDLQHWSGVPRLVTSAIANRHGVLFSGSLSVKPGARYFSQPKMADIHTLAKAVDRVRVAQKDMAGFMRDWNAHNKEAGLA